MMPFALHSVRRLLIICGSSVVFWRRVSGEQGYPHMKGPDEYMRARTFLMEVPPPPTPAGTNTSAHHRRCNG